MAIDSPEKQPDVFRSDLLDNLNALRDMLPRREIRLLVYRSGAIVLRLTFDLSKEAALTAQNWFSQTNLKSSWPVLDVASKTFNYFSVVGAVSVNPFWAFQRRFFINFKYGNCLGDTGVLMVTDIDDECSYAKGNFTAAPRILYNTRPDGDWTLEAERADRLSLFVA